MTDRKPQSYATHRRWVPGFHIVLASFLLLNFVYAVWTVIAHFSLERVVHLGTAMALWLLYWYTRVFACGVQDRVIRTEERLRLERLAPESFRPRIAELTVDQFVALRFASDAELPALAQRVLDEKIGDKDAIKKLIREWRADDDRI